MDAKELEKVLGLAGISQSEWDSCAKAERESTFGSKIRRAQLKYHPDSRPKDLSEAEIAIYDENILLLNGIFDDDLVELEHNTSEKSTRPAKTPAPEVFFKEFLDKVKSETGEGLRFSDWQAAFEHYFVKEIDSRWNFHDAYKHKIKDQAAPIDYEQEFSIGLLKGIYKEFIIPGSRDDCGAGPEYLRPSFRCEADLLIQICKFQRHTGFEQTIISVATNRLFMDEAFWRKALRENPKAILSLYHSQPQSYEKKALKTASLYDVLTNDEELMRSVVEREPKYIWYIGTKLADNEELLSLAVEDAPRQMMEKASTRLRHISNALAQRACVNDVLSIEYINFDENILEEKQAYLRFIEVAWEQLPQKTGNRVFDLVDDLPTREKLIDKLQGSFKDKAQRFWRETETLIPVIRKAHRELSNKSSNVFTPMHAFFSHTLVGRKTPAAPEKLTEVLEGLLNYLEGRMYSKQPSIESRILLKENGFEESIKDWQEAKDNLFGDDDTYNLQASNRA